MKQYKNWEPSYLDSGDKKIKMKADYKKLSDQIFNEAKIINFSKNRDEKVYFKDIFRAINAQTGDDKKVLLHIESKFEKMKIWEIKAAYFIISLVIGHMLAEIMVKFSELFQGFM